MQKKTAPFSVLMSVYEKESPKKLEESLNSIYFQQTLKPDEIILVEDGPLNEDLYAKIHQWQVKLNGVLKTLKLKKNSGLAKALNSGLLICKNDLVARMDSDDISLPERFQIQYKFMIANPDIDVISGQIEEWNNELTIKISERNLPTEHSPILNFAKSRSPISHPAAFFRKEKVVSCGGYPEIYPEDYALWGIMLSRGCRFANVPEIILKMRISDSITSRRGFSFLKGEIKTFLHFYKIGLLNKPELIKSIIIKSFLRLSPNYLKLFLYKRFR